MTIGSLAGKKIADGAMGEDAKIPENGKVRHFLGARAAP
jgi:hypothetical protein